METPAAVVDLAVVLLNEAAEQEETARAHRR